MSKKVTMTPELSQNALHELARLAAEEGNTISGIVSKLLNTMDYDKVWEAWYPEEDIAL